MQGRTVCTSPTRSCYGGFRLSVRSLRLTWVRLYNRWEIHPVLFYAIELKRIQLGQGADSSRADDTRRLKVYVVNWLMQGTPKPDPPLNPEDKTGRGFYNDTTGRLLCPVDFNWNDAK